MPPIRVKVRCREERVCGWSGTRKDPGPTGDVTAKPCPKCLRRSVELVPRTPDPTTHHPTLDNLRYEHGLDGCPDEWIAHVYGVPERQSWAQWHAWDHEQVGSAHLSDVLRPADALLARALALTDGAEPDRAAEWERARREEVTR